MPLWKGKQGVTVESLRELHEQYKKDINPSGELPAMQFMDAKEPQTGKAINESQICAEVIDRTYTGHGPTLMPRDAERVGRVRMCLKAVEPQLFHFFVYLKEQDPRKDAGHAERLEAGLKLYAESMDEDLPYFFGQTFSILDICVAPFFQRAALLLRKHRGYRVPGSVPGGAREAWEARLEQWWKAVQERAAWQKTKLPDHM
eukprot:gene11248-18628_t